MLHQWENILSILDEPAGWHVTLGERSPGQNIVLSGSTIGEFKINPVGGKSTRKKITKKNWLSLNLRGKGSSRQPSC